MYLVRSLIISLFNYIYCKCRHRDNSSTTNDNATCKTDIQVRIFMVRLNPFDYRNQTAGVRCESVEIDNRGLASIWSCLHLLITQRARRDDESITV